MTLFLVLLVVAVLFLAGASQSWVTRDVKRRVQVSALERAALVQALNAVEQGAAFVRVAAGGEGEGDSDLAEALRELRPGEVLELDYDPPYIPVGGRGLVLAVEESAARAWLVAAEEGEDPATEDCDEPAPEGRGEGDRLYGILELHAISRADSRGLRVRAEARMRRQFQVILPPCAEEDAARQGLPFASLVEVHPVELMRAARVWRVSGAAEDGGRR